MPAEKEAYNSVQLIGNLGADPEMRYVGDGGSCVTEIRIAVYAGKDKRTSEPKPSMWFTVKAWNAVAEQIATGFRKGDRIRIVEGQLSQDSWQDRETGKNRTKDYVLAWKVEKIERQQRDEHPNVEEPEPADYDDIPF
jgi:single-strand DNA-binding protein